MADQDVSGRTIPTRGTSGGGAARYVAIPPVDEVPNELAVEFMYSGYASLAAGGVSFVQLTDPQTNAPFARKIDQRNRARLASLFVYCPDMVAAVAPYLTVSLLLSGAPANAWSYVPIYPRAGAAQVTFSMETRVAPGMTLQLWAENTDANTHFLAVYLYGWYWAKDMVQA